jgi:hypothetical protein
MERIIEEVTSGRQAKDWIMSNVPGITAKELNNNNMIHDVAFKNKISFPNWKE